MKFDMHQAQIESVQISPGEDWYDSNSYESIQSKSESFMIRFTKIWVDSGKKEVKNWCWQHLNRFGLFVNRFKKTVNRFTVNLFKKTVNRFTVYYSGKLWIDSLRYYSGKFNSIQKEWHKEDGEKQCLIWINESWIESSNSRKDFPYMTTHKTSKDHMKMHKTWKNHMTTHKTSKNQMTLWDMVC